MHRASSITFLGEGWMEFILKLIWKRGEIGSKFGWNGIWQLNIELKNSLKRKQIVILDKKAVTRSFHQAILPWKEFKKGRIKPLKPASCAHQWPLIHLFTTQCGVSTLSLFIAECQARKLWMPIFEVFGFDLSGNLLFQLQTHDY